MKGRYNERSKRSLSIMKWNWQKPDWPHFFWDEDRIVKHSGVRLGMLSF
jgi:hypothetical protein